MIDLDLLREKSDFVKAQIAKKDASPELVESFLELDGKWRELLKKQEDIRSSINASSKGGKPSDEEIAKIKDQKHILEGVTEELNKVASQRDEVYATIPNLPLDKVPVGEGESANTVVRQEGTIKLKEGLSHEELLEKALMIDQDQASDLCGSRFRYLIGDVALAHLKLMLKAFEFAVAKGFKPVIPPTMTKEKPLFGTGYLPTFKEEIYRTDEGMYMTGTSEPMLVALNQGKTIKNTDLPLRYVGFSTCFRKEAGSYGKDTKGLFRQHQFDKVEMVSIVSPDKSEEELEYLLSIEEEFVKSLGLPYQVVSIGSGDLGPSAAQKYDIECYFPGQSKYRETHSVSNCTDYQARRLKIRTSGDDAKYAHTLNGTLATERLLLSIVENNQEDGQVKMPWEILK